MITNILLTQGGHNKGYLAKDLPLQITPTFATANVGVRRSALDEIGGFDILCRTGEDMDLGLRMAKSKWEVYFEPRAVIYHKHRVTFSDLIKQWFGYANSHPYVLKKHTSPGLQIFWMDRKRTKWRAFHLKKILGFKAPIYIFVYLTPFHLFHFFGGLAVIGIWESILALQLVALPATAYFGSKVLKPRYVGKYSFKERVIFAGIRYLLNWAYVLGGLWGGFKSGVLYIEATREN